MGGPCAGCLLLRLGLERRHCSKWVDFNPWLSGRLPNLLYRLASNVIPSTFLSDGIQQARIGGLLEVIFCNLL